jgi:DegV family protein with EDD domain
MHIVTDSGMDLAAEQMAGLNLHVVPLTLTLNDSTYRSGVDIQADEFYRLLATSDQYPTTAQPAVGDFVELYRKLAATDPHILSIHISSGLSGTLNSAKAAAEQAPEAKITIADTKTLSAAQGWQVLAAAQAAQAGWSLERILALLKRIGDATDGIYTIATLKYLIHGGRISHLRGLAATALNIKPIIGVEKVGGTYVQRSRARTLNRAIVGLADVVAEQHAPGTPMRFQIVHAQNPEGVELLRPRLAELYPAKFLPPCVVAPVLGAHTGVGLVGLIYAPEAAFAEIP